MKLSTVMTDNISELLTKIIEFTQTRQKVLSRNIKDMHSPGFVPHDLEVESFSRLMHEALNEYICNKRLLLRDTETLQFGEEGAFEALPAPDTKAKVLLEKDPDEYLSEQVQRLMENSLNQRVAAELLKQRQNTLLGTC